MDAKYEALLDDEVKAYLAKCDALYPQDAVDLDIEGQRRVYDTMCAAFDTGRPSDVSVSDRAYDGVPCRCYKPTNARAPAVVVYLHGGGFVVGGLDSHDSICAEISSETGLRVVSVAYPLAPETVYPDDFNATLRAYRAIAKEKAAPILLCGDSAGGNLAAALSGALRGDEAAPKGQVLIYPGLGGDHSLPSYQEHANAPQLTLRDLEFYSGIRAGGSIPQGDPLYAPLKDTSFAGLPKTVVVSAACDPLASDGEVYVQKIVAAGGAAQFVNEYGLVHGYLRARMMSRKAAASFSRICRALSDMS